MGKALQRALVVNVTDETQRVTVVHALGAAVAQCGAGCHREHQGAQGGLCQVQWGSQ